MSLRWKLFLSYLVVAAIPLLVLVLSTAYVAPANFSHQMMGMGRGARRHVQQQAALNTEINANFRKAVNQALIQAGGAAILAAAVISWLISTRLTHTLRALVRASCRIATGRYEERLLAGSKDEIGELIVSFNQMAATLAETEALRQQLIGDVTHELKTPLASIKGYMEGLEDGIIPATPATYHAIHREADRLQRLVQDLQALSQVEARQISLNPQVCQPRDLIETAIHRLRPQFLEKEIMLQASYPAETPCVQADPDRTIQVLINLLGNALQYTATGGAVTVHLTAKAPAMQFRVQDTGIGLAAGDLERVFQRFYRVDKSRARSSGGNGIGLTIARHLIEIQGGRLWVESAGIGQGSTFIFTLPLA